jgi:putative peptide zinc metalloprotease protein
MGVSQWLAGRSLGVNRRSHGHDWRVEDWAGLRLRLRPDIRTRKDCIGGIQCVVLEDPVTTRFYRIGEPEFTLISALDGSKTVTEAVAEVSPTLREHAFELREAATVCRWLLDTGLAVLPGDGVGPTAVQRKNERVGKRRMQSVVNALFIRIPLVNPDRFLNRIQPLCRLLSGRVFAAAWILVTLFSLYRLAMTGDRFARAAMGGILAPANWGWLLLVVIGLKLMHELYHGMVCKRYGGTVYEFGVILILFMPIGYTDATGAWGFSKRRQRIHVSAAGILVELLAGAIGLIIWSYSPDGLLGQIARNTVFIGGLATLMFNLNPLMRFDGYYIFADWVDIPNLYQRGQNYIAYLIRRYLSGLPMDHHSPGIHRLPVVKVYGVAALIWRILVFSTILLVASTLFQGAGLVLAIAAFFAWFISPFVRWIGDIKKHHDHGNVSWIRAFGGPLLFVLLSIFLIARVPWPAGISAPATIDYAELIPIRSETRGVVESVNVESGTLVKKGTVLVHLKNPELVASLEMLEMDLNRVKARINLYYSKGELAAYQAEMRSREALDERIQDIRQRVDALNIRAPFDGMVLGARTENMPGLFVQRGESLFNFAKTEDKEIIALIPQWAIEHFRDRIGQSVRVFGIPGVDPFFCRLESIEPRATSKLDHVALTVLGGGPLAVRSLGGGKDEGESQYELLEPHFKAVLELPGDLSPSLGAGMVCRVGFHSSRQSVLDRLSRRIRHWFSSTTTRSH